MLRTGVLLALAATTLGQEPSELADDLAGSDYVAQLTAVRGFERLGARGAAAVPRLIELLAAPGETADLAAQALGHIGAPAVGDLRKQTEARSARIRALAAGALGAVGPAAAPAVGDLIRLLRAEEADVRLAAARALGDIGPVAAAAIDALLALREEPDLDVLNECARSLGRIGADLDRTVAVLLNSLRPGILGPAYDGAHDGLLALGARAVPYVLKELPKAEQKGDYWAALVLLLSGHDAAWPALVEILAKVDVPGEDVPFTGPDSLDPKAVVAALAAFGEVAAVRMAPLLAQETPKKLKALAVLERLGGDAHPARGAIVKAASDEEPAVRRRTIGCLAALGEVDVLLRMLESDADLDVRIQVCLALDQTTRDVRVARALAKAAGDGGVRQSALIGLGRLRVKTPEVAAVVVAGLADGDENVRIEAVNAARSLALTEAVDGLLILLEAEDTLTRMHAAQALGAVGRGAARALPALEALRERTTDDKYVPLLRDAIACIRGER